MKNKLYALIHRIKLLPKITQLKIKTSDIDNEGDPFVELHCGTKFYGEISSNKYDNFLYYLLPKSTRSVLNRRCFKVAIDIVIRYKEGALMYGGPSKQLQYNVSRSDTVVEMGGYQGFYSIKLAQQVGVSGKVVAIEPEPNKFRLLTKNKNANNLKNLKVVQSGVWNSHGFLKFNKKKNDSQSSSIDLYTPTLKSQNLNEYFIEVNDLDSILASVGISKVSLMIIQLNGSELKALEGLFKVSVSNFSIAARYDLGGDDAAMLIYNFLIDKGYSVNIVNNDFIFASIT